MTAVRIALAETDAGIAATCAVMRELRGHIPESEYVARVQKQRASGYCLAALSLDGVVTSVAGYRFIDNLFAGHFMYVDDLVTAGQARSLGHGQRLFDWLRQTARDAGCRRLILDSGVQRHRAHKFYLANDMSIAGYHFMLDL